MKSKANNITFCVTWVVDKTLYTHFRNCSWGLAKAGSRGIEAFGGRERTDSALFKSSIDSNQNKQVI
jgi:hypothetical protein